MLEIRIHGREMFDERTEQFICIKDAVLKLEHSLISISKWEAKCKKPFLDTKEKTFEELKYYVECMTLNTNVDASTYDGLTQDDYNEVSRYINDDMTATWFNNDLTKGTGGRGQIVTSELIYYWMIAYNIPSEYQKWHLNRLLTLIRICEIKNRPPKKMNKNAIRNQYRSINESRRKALGTKG